MSAEQNTTRKNALVTGATGGIGREIVRSLAADHHVYALGRNAEKLEDLTTLGPAITPVRADLVQNLLEEGNLPIELTSVDVIVHAAAIAPKFVVEDAEVSTWREAMDLNVIVPAELTRRLTDALIAAEGTVIFINSGAGSGAHAGNTVYAATKHALRGLADGLRKELAKRGVRVSSIVPGPTDTAMLRALEDDYRAEWYIRPEEIARAVRMVVDAGPTTQITDVSVRPRVELADRRS